MVLEKNTGALEVKERKIKNMILDYKKSVHNLTDDIEVVVKV